MKRAIVIILLALSLAGCTKTICETPGIKAERTGANITIEDKNTGSIYTLHAIMRPKGSTATIKRLIDTDTIQISAGGKLIIVTDKISGKITYIIRH